MLNGDGTLQRWARVYASHGIAMAHPDGVMPEDGGHDSGYQALGLTFAIRYLELSGQSSQSSPLYQTIQRGEEWELSRVRSDGSVIQTGDTRTAGCKERDPEGHCKSVFVATIFQALARWAALTGDLHFQRIALDVWLNNWRSQPGDVLPAAGLFATPSAISNGQWLTVSGAQYQPLERVKLYLDDTLIQTLQCDQIGSFGGHSPLPNAHFQIESLSDGVHTLIGKGNEGTVRKTTITVSG
jgi:hypothetical protein